MTRQGLTAATLNGQRDHWRQTLADAPALLTLPTDRPRPAEQSFAGATLPLLIDASLTAALKRLSQQHGSTLFMTVLSAWAVVLSRLAGQDDVVIGIPSANRQHHQVESLVGFFVNTLALRVDLSGTPAVAELLARVRRTVIDAQGNQDLPFEQVVDALRPARNLAHTPLFQVMFSWQDNAAGILSVPGLRIAPAELAVDTVKFDLELALGEVDGGIGGQLAYATALFDAVTLERHLAYLLAVLRAMAADVDGRQVVARIPLLSDTERTLLLDTWNRTAFAYPQDRCLHGLFEDQVRRTPDATALLFAGQSVSYRDLNARANRLAHHLIERGVGPDRRVALCLDRSIAMVVGLLAILKAGGAYVPLDPTYPRQRLAQMLVDAEVALLLTDAVGREALGEEVVAATPIVDLDPVSASASASAGTFAWDACSDDNPDPEVLGLTSRHLAYVIYTSGSTGVPKGAQNEHRAIVNRLFWMQQAYALTSDDVVLQKTPFSFDVSVWEFFWTLLQGATLVLAVPEGHKDPAYLISLITEQGVTTAHFVPSMLGIFLDAEGVAACTSLRRVVCSGEALAPSTAQRCRQVLPGANLYNLYGPTEAAVDVTAWTCPDDFHGGVVPIGKPIFNTRIYLLDPHGAPVPLGVTGELYIGGAGVARGYLNRPELTAERFIESPFVAGDRLYRTGDLARYLPDGNIEYLGRSDHQVKIRGFRIELGEIEACLLGDPSLAQAVVIAREDRPGHQQLVGYVVPASGLGVEAVNAEALRQTLAQQLPDYMVPVAIVCLARLPLTPNGKLDRRELPVPDFSVSISRDPRTPQEEILAGLFAEVLGLERVGVDDSFFNLGGHSLLATRLISRIRSTLQVEIAIPTLFHAPTVAQLALRLDGGGVARAHLQAMPRPVRVPLSFSQQRLWFLHQFEGSSPTYNIAVALRLRGALNKAALAAALQDVVGRHESLRTVFNEEHGNPYQHVLAVDSVGPVGPVDLVDSAVHPAAHLELLCHDVDHASLQAAIDAAVGYAFDISGELPLRASVFQLGADDAVLLLLIHHIAGDGASLAPLARDLSIAYRARCLGLAPDWVALPVQYADFTLWQRALLGVESDAQSMVSRQIAYWKQALAGLPELISLPTDFPRPVQASYRGEALELMIDAELHGALVALARDNHASLFMVLHAAVALLLSRLGAGADIVLGTPIAGRTDEALDDLVGFFVNILVLRTDVSGNPSFRQLLRRVCDTNLQAYAHQDLPFERLVDLVSPARSTAHHPLFQVMLVLQNNAAAVHQLHDLDVSLQPLATQVAKFDLTFDFSPVHAVDGSTQGLRLRLEYATDLFEAATVGRFASRLLQLFDGITRHADQAVGSFDLLSGDERTLLLDTWNQTERSYPQDRCLHALFEDQVRKTPNAIALVFDQRTLSYQELNARANRLAHHLITLGVAPDQRVALCLERSIGMIVGLLAILKAGGAYLPLDPAYPRQRLEQTLVDAGVTLLLIDAVGRKAIGDDAMAATTIIDLDPGTASTWGTCPDSNLDSKALGLNSRHIAYVIYTSGSTGKPKGVMVEHAGVINLAQAQIALFKLSPASRILQFASIGFDASIFDIVMAFGSGAALYLLNENDRHSASGFSNYLRRNGITHATLPPALLKGQEELESLSTLETLVLAGEAPPPALIRAIDKKVRVFNAYGPTEDTVWTTAWLRPDDFNGTMVPIGRPIFNTRIYLLDPHGAPVPLGVTGELYIGGAGVARGYLNRPELTAERFIESPFVAGDRLYRTGDLARYLPDGNIDYLGRSDHQVKIRGFRIELGEIEACLLGDPSLAQAVVIAREDRPGHQQLVGYVVPASGLGVEAVDAEALRQTLAQQLPDYMVPVAIVCLARLPLTPNGKLDRRELPVPDFSVSISRDPRTPQEEILAGLFAEVLGLERVGVDDSFFNLGGHSLLATRLISRIRSTLQVEIAIPTLFHAPTVAQLALRLDGGGVARAHLQAMPRPVRVPLSFSQQRLWFLHQFEGSSPTYNIAVALRLRGALNKAALAAALQDVVGRHESLRTVFNEEHGNPYQHVLAVDSVGPVGPVDLVDSAVHPAAHLELLCHDVDHASLQAAIDAAVGYAFDISGELPLRASVFQLGADDAVLLLLIHHIAGDGASLAPLARDLSIAYRARCLGLAPDWVALPVQYADFTLWQRALLGVESDAQSMVSRQIAYWKQALAGLPELISLPTDFPRPVQASYRGEALELMIDAELHGALVALARDNHASLFMVLHAAVALLLSRLGAGADIVLGTPIAGRTDEALDDLVGFFVNILVLRTDVSGNPSFRQLLRRVCDTNLQAYAHQDLPFERLVDLVSPARSTAHHPLFQVMLVLQNNAAAVHQLHDLDVSLQPLATQVAKFDLTFDFSPVHAVDGSTQGLRLRLEYATDLFEAATVGRFASRLLQLFDGITRHADQAVGSFDLLSGDERTLLLDTWNQTERSYPQDRCLHALFEDQVRKTPDAIALVFDQQALSYRELNTRANRLAHHLIALGVAPESVVAIALPRSMDLVVTILAVLKAGGAYLPLDPEYPAERLASIIEDAKPGCILTCSGVVESLSSCSGLVVLDNEETIATLADYPALNPDNSNRVSPLLAQHPAYVIFTSGSTGRPKGVMIPHENVVHLFSSTEHQFGFDEHDVWTLFHSYAFDFSVWELWGPLLYGGKLVVVPYLTSRTPAEFLELLARERVTVLNQTPSAFYQLMQADEEHPGLSAQLALRYVIFGGEMLDPARLHGWYSRHADNSPKLINMYGITETTVHVTYLPLDATCVNWLSRSMVGPQISNLQAYVLDDALQPAPIGVPGELYVAGCGLARGYLNRASLSAERFVANPFGLPGQRMYRTGDVVRRMADGNLEYFGRSDHQVKIRGFRIELGEIEACLLQEQSVGQAVVIAREDRPGHKQLVGYVVPASGLGTGDVDTEALRRMLSKKLPDHMVPAAIVIMGQLPLTPNGKLDRKGLPAPERDAFAGQEYQAPQGSIERILAELWQDLLGVEQVGRHDNFFQLGGHSLLALQLMAHLRNRGLNGGIRELFATPVLCDLALTLQYHSPVSIPPNRITSDGDTIAITPDMLPLIELTQTDIDCIASKVPGGIANIQDIYALTPLQDGILFHHLLATQNDPYLLATRMVFAERALLDRYLGAVQKVVDRHDILRTAFLWEELTVPAQVVLRKAALHVEEIALTPDDVPSFAQLERQINLAHYRLNLTQAPLLRFVVAQEPGTHRWLMLSLQHHLTDDRTSLDIQNTEIQAFIMGQEHTLAAPTPFRNLIAQIQATTGTEMSETFFRDMLADIDEPTAPFGLIDVHGDGSNMRESRLMLPQSLGDRLRIQAKRVGVTVASLCHFAWGQVVARTSGRKQVVFGTVLFGRTNAGADAAMGPFINTLPLRLDLDASTVEVAVRETHARLSNLLHRVHASLATAQRCSGVAAPMPLFSSLLNYRHNNMSELDAPDRKTIEDADHPWYGIEWLGGEERTNYPFTMSIDDFEQALQLTAKVAQPHAPERICALMQRSLEQLVDALETASLTPVFQLDVLPLDERTLLLDTWNQTGVPYPQDRCLHELFEDQVRKTPDATALVFGNTSLTYAQLNCKANRLAHLLIERDVGPESIVAIALPKSFDLIVSMLGVLKAGGAYLPLDPGYPAEHLSFMIRDASPRVILTTRKAGSSLTDCAPLLYLDELEQALVPNTSPNAPPNIGDENPSNGQRLQPLHVQHPAYIIYTSGSTGLPKGAVILHQGLVNHLARSIDAYYSDGDGGSPLVLSTSFDGSVTALYGPLLTGQTLTIFESGKELDSLLSGRVEPEAGSKAYAVLKITPSHLKLLNDAHESAAPMTSARTLILGGEALLARDILSWQKRQPGIRIANQYGPTETTVGCCTFEVFHTHNAEQAIPIGRPIWNTQVFVLDDRLQPVPIGAPGELYIAGHGLARGYLKHPGMTASRFIANPFGSAGSRMYRSGDLVRWLADGNLEFLGRTDHQIKLRGFRIELGEIEARLGEHPAIAQVVVLVKENGTGDQCLVAYVVAKQQEQALPPDLAGTLRSHLSAHLPDHMIPAAFVRLEQLPLTPSGKLDRKALPELEEQNFVRRPYASPQGEIEEAIAEIWENLLGIERVSRYDNFFALGGHSLLAVRLLGRLQGKFGVPITLAALFDCPDLASFAKSVLISIVAGEFDSEDLQNLLSAGAQSNEST